MAHGLAHPRAGQHREWARLSGFLWGSCLALWLYLSLSQGDPQLLWIPHPTPVPLACTALGMCVSPALEWGCCMGFSTYAEPGDQEPRDHPEHLSCLQVWPWPTVYALAGAGWEHWKWAFSDKSFWGKRMVLTLFSDSHSEGSEFFQKYSDTIKGISALWHMNW